MENNKFISTKMFSGNLRRILFLRKENVINTMLNTGSAVLWIGFDGFRI